MSRIGIRSGALPSESRDWRSPDGILEEILESGIELVLCPRPEVPLVTVTFLWEGGALLDAPDHSGQAQTTAELLVKGTKTDDAITLATRFEFWGADFETWAGRECLGITLSAPRRVFPQLWDLVQDVFESSRFSASELHKQQKRAIAAIRVAKDGDPRSLLPVYADSWIYGSRSPYGHPVGGDEATLGQLEPGALRRFWFQHLRDRRAVVSVAGDFDPDEIRTSLTRIFHSRKGHAPGGPDPVFPLEPPIGTRGLFIDRPGSTQSYFWMGGLGVDCRYPGRIGLELVQSVLGGQFNSLLNRRLRIEEGLTYGAHAGYTLPSFRGVSYLTSYAPMERTRRAMDATFDVLRRTREEGLLEADLKAGRLYLKGQEAFRYETTNQWSLRLALRRFHHLALADWAGYAGALDQVSSAQAGGILREVFPAPEDCFLVVIGDARLLLRDLSDLGEWSLESLSSPGFGPVRPQSVQTSRGLG